MKPSRVNGRAALSVYFENRQVRDASALKSNNCTSKRKEATITRLSIASTTNITRIVIFCNQEGRKTLDQPPLCLVRSPLLVVPVPTLGNLGRQISNNYTSVNISN